MSIGPGEPVPLSRFIETALYNDERGFYATSGRAGRRGDFLTSPEVGPLFGAVVARALDAWWDELGQPSPYAVADVGAGPGTLARAVRAAQPQCLAALRYTMIERSAAQRASHPVHEALHSTDDWPDEPFHIVIANELLDNMPFDLLVFDGSWREAWTYQDDVGRWVELLRPTSELVSGLPEHPALGARAPRQDRAAAWVRDALARVLPGGRLLAFDYGSTTQSMVTRPWREWLRTYRQHERGDHYLVAPGSQDVTCEVALDQLPTPDTIRTQAQWLALHGIDELVDEGRRIWNERRSVGDLAALTARSRVREAEALTDANGLGAFWALEWLVPTNEV